MNVHQEKNNISPSSIQNIRLYGEYLPKKLRLLFSELSIKKIAEKHEVDHRFVSRVIKGERKSKRVADILKQEFDITLDEIQLIIYEHIRRDKQGKPITDEEAIDWHRTIKTKGGKQYDEFESSYYNKKKMREYYYKRKRKQVSNSKIWDTSIDDEDSNIKLSTIEIYIIKNHIGKVFCWDSAMDNFMQSSFILSSASPTERVTYAFVDLLQLMLKNKMDKKIVSWKLVFGLLIFLFFIK